MQRYALCWGGGRGFYKRSRTRFFLCCLQRLANKKQKDYLMSSTHLRLVHGDVCTGVNAIIPDTNGKGGPKGSDKAGGDGQGGDKSGGSKGGILRGFFLLLFIGGIVAVAGGLIWSHCLSEAQRDIAKERLAPVLTVLAGLWEMVLGWVVDAVDWTRARAQNVPILNRFIGRGYSGGGYGLGGYGEGYDYEYEPLRDAGNEGGLDLDIDPEDRGSASLVAGHLGGGTPR